ncbi:hypothetical protein BD410DRAFT_779079 [Rickenella mellea]|uniref:Fungal-type protein kinase domain-containing protein n=1 Tax=Rickenella mellea TaxID=50990 RepID=A0A4Y7PEZ3_9AGAM|nr:hypothetical protein BD410DRAFT_779079 [Rickenella mellea]
MMIEELVNHDIGGHIPCYDVEELISAVLPSVSEPLFKQLRESVFGQRHIKARFGDTRPSEGHTAEDVAFLPLATLFADVATAVSEDDTHESLVVMEPRPNQSSDGDTLHQTRPDAQTRVKQSRAAGIVHHPTKTEPLFNASWYDIIMTYEYKTKKNDVYFLDNVKKVLWSMSQTMSMDPTRLSTLGLTIEDTTARLWYCDRSSWAVSTPFDIFEAPEYLLRIFIGLSIASIEELGYDSSMERIAIDGVEQFHITVTSHDKSHPRRTYQTVDWITNSNADYVIGRGTRVWRVRELDANTGELGKLDYALKDSWVEANRVLEGEWYQVLYDAAKDDPARMKQTEEHFLKVRAHGVVHTTDDEEQTTLSQRRNRCIEHADVLKLCSNLEFLATTVLSMTISNTPNLPPTWIPFLGRKFQNRRHYRIVLIGIGSPLDRCTQ